MSKLNKEELLEVLKIWYIGKHTQAYKQIWEMIKKPEATEEWLDEKEKELFDEIIRAESINGCFDKHFNSSGKIGIEKRKKFIRKLVEETK